MVNSFYNFRFYLAVVYTIDCEWKIIWSATMLRQWFYGQQVFFEPSSFLPFYLVYPHNNGSEKSKWTEHCTIYVAYTLMSCITNLLKAKNQTITEVQIFVELTVFVERWAFRNFCISNERSTYRQWSEPVRIPWKMLDVRLHEKGLKKPRRQTPHIKIVYCIRLTYAIMYAHI